MNPLRSILGRLGDTFVTVGAVILFGLALLFGRSPPPGDDGYDGPAW